jgi:hypothetical protein
MQNREAGLQTIYDRIYQSRDTLGLKGFKRSPTRPIDEKYLPCVFMIEDVDEVIEISQRNTLGYPMRRQLEVVLEIVSDSSYDIKKLYREVRSVVLAGDPVVADNTFIREIRTEGPTGYGLPNMLGMRLVLSMFYTDEGN